MTVVYVEQSWEWNGKKNTHIPNSSNNSTKHLRNRGNIDTSTTFIYDVTISSLGTVTSIKSGGGKTLTSTFENIRWEKFEDTKYVIRSRKSKIPNM